ncbi:MAG: NUDIX hydrolase [Nitrososphaeraceae archaeon]
MTISNNWKTLENNRIYENRWITLYQDKVQVSSSGNTIEYTWYKSPDVVIIVPFLDNNTVVMIKQFRYPLQKILLEFPAGHIEPGENMMTTAKRELLEETGYLAKTLDHVYSYHPSVSKSRQIVHLFKAAYLTKERPKHEPTEEITDIEAIAVSQLKDLIKEKKVENAGTLIAYLICCV